MSLLAFCDHCSEAAHSALILWPFVRRSMLLAQSRHRKIKSTNHGLLPHLCLDRRSVYPFPGDLRCGLPDPASRPNSQHLREYCTVPGTATGKCGAVAERRNSPLAPQHVLDACRLVLHFVDDRPASMDLLRGLSSPAPARHVSRRHYFLPVRYPPDGGAGPSSTFEAKRATASFWVHRLYTSSRLVDLSIRLRRAPVDVRGALSRPIQRHLRLDQHHPEHGHCCRLWSVVAAEPRHVAH